MASFYHAGELSVQERAGVREMADRIGKSIGPPFRWLRRSFCAASPWQSSAVWTQAGECGPLCWQANPASCRQ